MRQPRLHRLQMVLRRKGQPPLTQRTKHPLRIELPHIRVPRKQRAPLRHRIRIPRRHFLGEAGLAMRVPWDRAVRAVRAEPYPLVARGAEDAVWLEGGDVGIGAEVCDALVFGAFCAPALGVCAADEGAWAWVVSRRRGGEEEGRVQCAAAAAGGRPRGAGGRRGGAGGVV